MKFGILPWPCQRYYRIQRRSAILTIVLLATTTWLYSKDITLKPIFFGIHRTTGGLWQSSTDPVSLAGWGLHGDGKYGAWKVSGDIILMRFFGLDRLPLNRLSPEQGFTWGQHGSDDPNMTDTDFSEVMISYDLGDLDIFFGKFSRSYGPGVHSLTISNKPPSYPQFGFDWQVTPNISFSSFHGVLFSALVDTHRTRLYGGGRYGTQKIYLDRYVVGRRLEWSPWESISIGLTETLIYGGRRVEPIYLISFVPLFWAEHYLADTDNLQMSADLTWRPLSKLKVYGVFLMDEWRPVRTFDKENNRNWFAWQAGIQATSLVRDNDHLIVEGTWTDHRINRHRSPINDFYTYNYPVGHWIGPHAQSLLAAYTVPLLMFRITAQYLYAKRGQQTEEMIYNQYKSIWYERFSGPTETFRTLDIFVAWQLFPRLLTDLWIELGVCKTNWQNAGFDPFNPEANNLSDTNKFSWNLAFYYNFNMPGYNITTYRP